MKRVFERLMLLLIIAAMLTGLTACSFPGREDDEDEDEEFDTEYGAFSDGAEWGNNYEGSAVYLNGKTAVVTITVTPEGTEFAEADIKSMKDNAKIALDFIEKQVAEYGGKCSFAFDEPGLNASYEYSDGDIIDFESDDYDGVLEEVIEEQLDTKKIRKKYKADGIAYLVLLNGTGDSFASAHWQEDEDFFQNEGAFVFLNSYSEYYEETPTGPNVYLYNLLQLFGAVMLEYPDATYGYTTALYEAVEENYNNDIMYSYYDDEGEIPQGEVTKEITDITAYSLGLINDFTELKANPSFVKKYKAAFTDDYMVNTKDGEDTSLYDYDDFGDGDFDIDFSEFEEIDEDDIEIEGGADLTTEDLDIETHPVAQ